MPAPATLPALLLRLPQCEQSRLKAAHAYAETHLANVPRRTGESYARHGLEVALTLKEARSDVVLLCVALLHDLLIHPDGLTLLRQAPLTDEERDLVQQMAVLRHLHIDESTSDLDQVIQAFVQHERLLPLRMAHRLNDMRRAERFSPAILRQVAYETMHMYTAIAGRLGMSRWRVELEDTSFRALHPTTVKLMEKRAQKSLPIDEICLRQTGKFLQRELKRNGIHCRLDYRIKGLYSLYRKMIIKRRRFEEMTDRLALRIIVSSVPDCYRALGVVHAVMHPIPGKLKDYIGAPKENGYRSIHTVVYPLPGVTDLPMEIQFRTEDMHQNCLYGPVSHELYKDAVYSLTTPLARVNLFRNLESLREEANSPKQFENVLRKYFSEGRVALFDEQNNIYHMKNPATALDFICRVHPGRWSKLKEVRINGRRRPLDTRLQDGDMIEARFGRSNHLETGWTGACAHADSRRLVREKLRNGKK